MPKRRQKESLTCTFPGCHKYRRSRGLCITHYSQQWAGKDLTPVRLHARGLTPKIRFDHLWRFDKETQCWNWEGAIHPQKGYGMFWFNSTVRNMYAHRAAWVLYNGDIPDDPNHVYRTLGVLHTCDNTLCVNPDHLFLGTHKENMHDAIRKHGSRTTATVQGEKHPYARLTEAQVREIRGANGTETQLAQQYGVSRGTINDVRLRRTWKHVED